MIQSLEVKNYKRIGNVAAKFSDFARINYFVGENGSGKSSILSYLYENYGEKTILIKDSLTSFEFLGRVDFDSSCDLPTSSDKWRDIYLDFFEKQNVIILDLIGYASVLSMTENSWNVLDQDLMKEAFSILGYLGIVKKPRKNAKISCLESEELTGGEYKIINIVYGILHAVKHKKVEIALVDEPCNHLHPHWQKRLPEVFEEVSARLGIQIFVATHSPFIISSSGKLSEVKNNPTQKVYFLKEGRIAAKRGNISNKGRKGYWGRKTAHISSKLLGAGLMDLVSPQTAIIRRDAPTFVLCEGEGEEEDAKIYNIIFNDRVPPVMFVSCRGSSQVRRTFQLLREIKPGLSADFEVLMVRDRDHDFPTTKDILKYEDVNEGTRILLKRAMEVYLYNTETATLFLKKFDKKLTQGGRNRLNKLQREIEEETKNGIPGNSYKERLITAFNQATFGLLYKYKPESNLSIPEKVASLIKPNTKTYRDLEKAIFR